MVMQPHLHTTPTLAALYGEPVTQRHVDWCAEHGHATHTVNGQDVGICPRCGIVTAPVERPGLTARMLGDVTRVDTHQDALDRIAADVEATPPTGRQTTCAYCLEPATTTDVPGGTRVCERHVPDAPEPDDFTTDHTVALFDALDAGEDGATSWIADERTDGYLVGLPGRGITFPSLVAVEGQDVAYWARRESARGDAATIGAWIDANTGVVYFDVCDWHANLGAALTLGLGRAELAVWDVEHAREVRTDGTVAACDLRPGDVLDGCQRDSENGGTVGQVYAPQRLVLDLARAYVNDPAEVDTWRVQTSNRPDRQPTAITTYYRGDRLAIAH